MAAIAPITINDGQSTPVAHTFNPVQSNPPHYRENGDSSIPVVGEPEIWLTMKRSTASSSVNRAKLTLRIPALEVTTASSGSGYVAPPMQAYFMQASVEFLLPDRSDGDQRKDLRVLLMNALSNSQVVSLVDSLEAPY